MRVTRLSAARHRSTACAAVAVVVAVAAPLPKEMNTDIFPVITSFDDL